MTTYTLKRKIFALTVDGGGKSLSLFKLEWTSGGGQEKLGKFTDWYKGLNTGLAATNNQLTQLANTAALLRLNNKIAEELNPGGFKSVALRANLKGYLNGLKAGQNSVGAFGGMKNTWNKWGTQGATGRLKLAGTVAGGLALAGLAAKGVSSMFGNKNKDNLNLQQ